MTEQEYFTVHHNLTINVEVLGTDFALPDEQTFVSEIPAPFIVASEFSHLDTLADNARLELQNKELKHVISLLDTQNSKLNLLLSFMLSQQDDISVRFQTTQFGASQLSYRSSSPVETDQFVRVKLFLDHPAAAIYCYAQVVECVASEQGFVVTLRYKMLREADQDLLIKAALYQQQKLLRQRSLERNKK
ncbi:PilZ domain-containing protein [Vibrio parahaemolyticus]|nr:PilZ domain-containing protein [Vibrio parahaemolyticus]EJG1675580.1 PilZ domain-containing protein [Vibrio parahaemolyticus]EJG1721248.1 PilZ domain-containing protein [Vibrio parahaemolyticus]EJG1759504.1 PilZ domain-containing protein [Vibrio parahaemolyticus]ELB2013219.1 PilZ domain-containing protein [Vibrio parahaemolyticus]